MIAFRSGFPGGRIGFGAEIGVNLRQGVLFLSGILVFFALIFFPAFRFATGVPTIEPALLEKALKGPTPPQMIDLRPREEFLAGHIPGARWIPLEGVEGYLSRRCIPPEIRIVVCDRDHPLRIGGATVQARHQGEVLETAGGMQGWRNTGLPVETAEVEKIPPVQFSPPSTKLSLPWQAVVTSLGVIIKPAYMLLCLGLIVVLARSNLPCTRIIVAGLVLFETGETFCLLDFLLRPSGTLGFAPLEFLHSAGMATLLGIVPWGLFRSFADGHFAFITIPEMQKETARMTALVLLGTAILSMLPLSVPLRPIHSVCPIFTSSVEYGFPLMNEFLDVWGFSLLGIASLLTGAVMITGWGPAAGKTAEFPIFLGSGFVAFAFWQSMLIGLFRETPFWGDIWEEATETVIMCGLLGFLLTFRIQLGLTWGSPRPPDSDSQKATK